MLTVQIRICCACPFTVHESLISQNFLECCWSRCNNKITAELLCTAHREAACTCDMASIFSGKDSNKQCRRKSQQICVGITCHLFYFVNVDHRRRHHLGHFEHLQASLTHGYQRDSTHNIQIQQQLTLAAGACARDATWACCQIVTPCDTILHQCRGECM